MRARWLERRDEGPGRRLLLSPLVPAGWVYAACASLHRGAYARGWCRKERLTYPVVSVGSLLVGGAGKTPFAAWLACALSRRGHRAALASRGTGRRRGAEAEVVSDGRFVRGRVETSGDEPMVLAARAPGVPVLVARHRARAGRRALALFGSEVLVLDDGFQHHRLARDADILVFDGSFGFGSGQVLPRGPLRESLGRLAAADAVVVIDGPLPDRDEKRLAALAPDLPRFDARRRESGLRPLAGGAERPPDGLKGVAVGMLCGLARPDSLRRSLERLGADVVAERSFPDHHRFRPRDLAGLADEAPLWVTTEKDAVKIPAAWARGADVRVLSLSLVVEREAELLGWLEPRLGSTRARR